MPTEVYIKFSDQKDKYFSLHKNDKQQGKMAHENTLYYEKYQTTDFIFFSYLHIIGTL
jgi:hypothetical protein